MIITARLAGVAAVVAMAATSLSPVQAKPDPTPEVTGPAPAHASGPAMGRKPDADAGNFVKGVALGAGSDQLHR